MSPKTEVSFGCVSGTVWMPSQSGQCGSTTVNNNNKKPVLGALRNQLLNEMGDQVWIEVKEQENGWDWEEPVIAATRDTFRASNALNELS